jgi:hypothetical protein
LPCSDTTITPPGNISSKRVRSNWSVFIRLLGDQEQGSKKVQVAYRWSHQGLKNRPVFLGFAGSPKTDHLIFFQN